MLETENIANVGGGIDVDFSLHSLSIYLTRFRAKYRTDHASKKQSNILK